MRGGPDPGLRGGVPARAERAAGRCLRGGHPAGHRHRAAQVADPGPGRRRAASGAPRPLAGPQPRLPALRTGHGGAAHPRSPVERRPAAPWGGTAALRGAGGRGGRSGGVRARGGRARRPGQPGGGAVQPAGRAGGGSRDGPRLRRARGGSGVDARRGAARPVRGGSGGVDRGGGPGRGPVPGRGGAVAGRARRGCSAGRRHPGRRRGRRCPVPRARVALLRPGGAAAPGRTAAAAAHPYALGLAAARLELRPVRRGAGGRRRALRRPGGGPGGGRRPGARTGGRLSARPGRAPCAAAPADAFSRRPCGRPVGGASGPVRGCDPGHHARRPAGAGRVRPADRGGRRCADREGGAGGAAPGRGIRVAGALAAAGRTPARGAQRRERRPAGARRGADPAPARRPRTARAAGPVEGPPGPRSGGRPQGRPSRFRAPGPGAVRPDQATARARSRRCGQPLRTPRAEYARPAAGAGSDRAAHRHRRLDRRHRKRSSATVVSGQPAAESARSYRARPLCLPTTRQHDRMRLRQNGPSPHSTGVHQPCSVADGGWRRPEVPARPHPRH